MVVRSTNRGDLSGGRGSDILTGIAQNGLGQIHIYAGRGDDLINLSFDGITDFSMGHHARGDADRDTNRGADIFNFEALDAVTGIVVGRIEDFDPSRDSLAINGVTLLPEDLQSGAGTTDGYRWRIVAYDADSRDSATAPQQWILIDTGGGFVFYALEGARVTNADGAANDSTDNGLIDGDQEAHFIGARGGDRVTADQLAALDTIAFVDPENVVPAGFAPLGGRIINDYDATYRDAQNPINGTRDGDLIAGGLNDDTIRAGDGDDRVWGGSGRDLIDGGAGDDTLFGGTGQDTVTGGAGNDVIHGGMGADQLRGATGDDQIFGGDGDDLLDGQQGADTLTGGDGADTLLGGEGDDGLDGADGADLLEGGSGADTLTGGAGADRLTGGAGADQFVFRNGDLIDWGDLTGNFVQRAAGLDLITDFTPGVDQIVFDSVAGVASKADLWAWRRVIDDNAYFMVEVRQTKERILVDVPDTTTWAEFFNEPDHFLIL